MEFPRPFTQPAVLPVSVSEAALEPNQIPTTAPAGRLGTRGFMKDPALLLFFWARRLTFLDGDEFFFRVLDVLGLAGDVVLLLFSSGVIPTLMTRGL
jgi:hypothetical protein